MRWWLHCRVAAPTNGRDARSDADGSDWTALREDDVAWRVTAGDGSVIAQQTKRQLRTALSASSTCARAAAVATGAGAGADAGGTGAGAGAGAPDQALQFRVPLRPVPAPGPVRVAAVPGTQPQWAVCASARGGVVLSVWVCAAAGAADTTATGAGESAIAAAAAARTEAVSAPETDRLRTARAPPPPLPVPNVTPPRAAVEAATSAAATDARCADAPPQRPPPQPAVSPPPAHAAAQPPPPPPPPHAPVVRVTDPQCAATETRARALELLTRGVPLTKYKFGHGIVHAKGSAQQKFVFVAADPAAATGTGGGAVELALCWAQSDSERDRRAAHGVALRSVERVVAGRRTRLYRERVAITVAAATAFSVLTAKRSYDFSAATQHQRDAFLSALSTQLPPHVFADAL